MEQLLTTKFYIPAARTELVSRLRLFERLSKGLPRKLTLISAPAGFGKTTLVSEWVNRRKSDHSNGDQIGNQVAWLSLDEGDNDLVRFLACFITALKHVAGVETSLGKKALNMLQSPQPPPAGAILTSLINDLTTLQDRIVFVIDDYDLIGSPQVDQAVAFILEHLPPQLHLVIATRDDPQLPLARLRARRQLSELRAADLRFTSSEAAEFLNQVMGLSLSSEDIAALDTRTEGWIAGLQLAAISIQGRQDAASLIKSFTGSHRFILDYLIEEVLERQPQSVQTFLLQTSVLDRLNGSLCDAVCGEPSPENSQAALEQLERANLFVVPLDDERHWYRYHHLFADLLRQQLRLTQPDWIPELHRRASGWYIQHGFTDQAIEHSLRAEEFEQVGNLIEEHFDAMFKRGEQSKLRRWLSELPVELVYSKPNLCIFYSWNLFSSGQLDPAERSITAAEKMLDRSAARRTETSSLEQGQLTDTEKITLRGKAGAIRAFIAAYRGDVEGTIQHGRQALLNLPDQELTWRNTAAIALGDAYDIKGDMAAAYKNRIEAAHMSKATGDIYLIMTSNLKVAAILRIQGQLQQVLEICGQQFQRAKSNRMSQSVVAGWLLALWGETLAELNNLDEALNMAEKGTELTRNSRDVAMIGWSSLCLVRVLFSSGDISGAQEVVEKTENISRETDMPLWITNNISAWQARIWLARGMLDTASQWLEESRLEMEGAFKYLQELENIAVARILIAQGCLEDSTRLLDRLLTEAETGGRTARVIEMLLLKALAFQVGGNNVRARNTLERTLSLARPGGFTRIFVDEGPRMARLLYKALACGIEPDYVRGLLGAFPTFEVEDSDPSKTQVTESGFVEPLSDREIEVLQLISEGLTNQEVGSRLYISLNTVKGHTRNIYGKLGVNNRTKAVGRARTLGILRSN